MAQFIKPSNHEELFRRVTSFASVEAKCIAQCTGCQCSKTSYDVTDAYDFVKNNDVPKTAASKAEFVTPRNFNRLVRNIVMNDQVTAAYCNCTACNSCRCDCSCRSVEFSSQSIW